MYLSRALSSTHFSPTHKTESGASVIVIINHHHHLDQTIIGAGAISFAYTNVYLLQPNVASLLPIHPSTFHTSSPLIELGLPCLLPTKPALEPLNTRTSVPRFPRLTINKPFSRRDSSFSDDSLRHLDRCFRKRKKN